MEIYEFILQYLPQEDYQFGFADLRGLLTENYKDYLSGISIMRKLEDDIIDTLKDGPTEEYLELYNKVNMELNEKIGVISDKLNSLGVKTHQVKSTMSEGEINEDFRKTLRSDISHKMVATNAGMGWIGKTDLFISKKFGPRVRLASILTDKELYPKTEPIKESLCGNCNICVKICPACAANGKLWNVNTDRDEFFDAFKCMAKCRELSRKNINKEATICGICLFACPYGRKNNTVAS